MAIALNALHQGDCVKKLAQVEPGSIDLVFADPPFNIGYKYDVYDDRRQADDYLAWSKEWMQGVHRALKPDGTFWLAIGDDFAAELKLLAQRELGFHCRSWVIWYYTFGVNCKYKFTRSHTHLFHFVKDRKKFTFNADDPAIRVPSARQIVYADDRANQHGRLPDDTWILRPQDVPEAFTPQEDVWYFARVAGTFKERAGFHGCQMPERLLARIILACSREGETVLDPFSGSGTTLIVAKKLNRQFVGFELSKDYVAKVRERLNQVNVGDELEGPADPLLSAPSTKQGKRLGAKKDAESESSVEESTTKSTQATRETSPIDKPEKIVSSKSIAEDSIELRRRGIVEAFIRSRDGHSADQLVADPALNAEFIRNCYLLGIPGEPAAWNRELFRLRKSSALRGHTTKKSIILPAKIADQFSFASEMAWHDIHEETGWTLDEILCDPVMASRFDERARALTDGRFTSFQYRWAALQIRKNRSKAIKAAMQLNIEIPARAESLQKLDLHRYVGTKGVYSLRQNHRKAIYVGAANDLGTLFVRLRDSFTLEGWRHRQPTAIKIYPTSSLIGPQGYFVMHEKPAHNMLLTHETSQCA